MLRSLENQDTHWDDQNRCNFFFLQTHISESSKVWMLFPCFLWCRLRPTTFLRIFNTRCNLAFIHLVTSSSKLINMYLQAYIIKGTHLGLVIAAGGHLTATFIFNYSLFKMAPWILPSMFVFGWNEKFEPKPPKLFQLSLTRRKYF